MDFLASSLAPSRREIVDAVRGDLSERAALDAIRTLVKKGRVVRSRLREHGGRYIYELS